MLNFPFKDIKTNIWVKKRKKVININNNNNQQCEKSEVVLGRAYQLPQRRPMDFQSHHLETV